MEYRQNTDVPLKRNISLIAIEFVPRQPCIWTGCAGSDISYIHWWHFKLLKLKIIERCCFLIDRWPLISYWFNPQCYPCLYCVRSTLRLSCLMLRGFCAPFMIDRRGVNSRLLNSLPHFLAGGHASLVCPPRVGRRAAAPPGNIQQSR